MQDDFLETVPLLCNVQLDCVPTIRAIIRWMVLWKRDEGKVCLRDECVGLIVYYRSCWTGKQWDGLPSKWMDWKCKLKYSCSAVDDRELPHYEQYRSKRCRLSVQIYHIYTYVDHTLLLPFCVNSSSAWRQQGLTGYCFKYKDRPFYLRTDDYCFYWESTYLSTPTSWVAVCKGTTLMALSTAVCYKVLTVLSSNIKALLCSLVLRMHCKQRIFLVQVRLRTEVLRTPSSIRPGFELMTSRLWQYISCHWDAVKVIRHPTQK